jgi:hypothetical protein
MRYKTNVNKLVTIETIDLVGPIGAEPSVTHPSHTRCIVIPVPVFHRIKDPLLYPAERPHAPHIQGLVFIDRVASAKAFLPMLLELYSRILYSADRSSPLALRAGLGG